MTEPSTFQQELQKSIDGIVCPLLISSIQSDQDKILLNLQSLNHSLSTKNSIDKLLIDQKETMLVKSKFILEGIRSDLDMIFKKSRAIKKYRDSNHPQS